MPSPNPPQSDALAPPPATTTAAAWHPPAAAAAPAPTATDAFVVIADGFVIDEDPDIDAIHAAHAGAGAANAAADATNEASMFDANAGGGSFYAPDPMDVYDNHFYVTPSGYPGVGGDQPLTAGHDINGHWPDIHAPAPASPPPNEQGQNNDDAQEEEDVGRYLNCSELPHDPTYLANPVATMSGIPSAVGHRTAATAPSFNVASTSEFY
jgi:hypothetical protein